MPAVGETDAGLFALRGDVYVDDLPRFAREDITTGARTAERNFLPFLAWPGLPRTGHATVACEDVSETIGMNTREDLATSSACWRADGITLSIVIPAYNEAAFIGTLLERIAAVDLTDLGVDDASHRRRRRLDTTRPPTSPSATASACSGSGRTPARAPPCERGIAASDRSARPDPGRRSRVQAQRLRAPCLSALRRRRRHNRRSTAAVT